ncbi:hypothetical protein [Nitrosococcus oceani]|uniref:hypothetical protein n=1 Tax=Nitrosococcus oceani TaxID=1229 RepID=UPI001E516841|nr:hypothetical protein [Nitrosococcus oceani]
MTSLGAGKPGINFDQVLALLLGLVRQLDGQGVPGRIADVASEPDIFHHVADFQRLDDHRLVIVNDLPRELMLEVVADTSDPLVSLGVPWPVWHCLSSCETTPAVCSLVG